MKFRTRLLILVLAVSLIPLVLSFVFQRTLLIRLGNKLAHDTRTLLHDNATNLLHSLIDEYDRILERDKAIALLTLQNQAQAIEARLATPQEPADLSSDDVNLQKPLSDLITTEKYKFRNEQGKIVPIPVSYSQQSIFLVDGVTPKMVTKELHQISTMSEVYKTLNNIQPNLFLWQYTTLRAGVHSCYPGKEGYPKDYDPRERLWYRDAVFKGETTQHILTDVTTGALVLTFSRPIYAADGKLAGVTALDIDYRQFFVDWNIPEKLKESSESMILLYHEDSPDPQKQLEILLSTRDMNHFYDWRTPTERHYIDITDPQLQQLQDDLIDGKSAVRTITYNGQQALWAYGVSDYNKPFPLVIVPYKQIVAQAINAETFVNHNIALSIRIGTLLTIIVVIVAIILAIVRSKKVTEPITQLSEAAKRLAHGQFDVNVKINTHDELGDLGDIFNRMSVSLKEREEMKSSLDLAKEIQQQLLPAAPPQCPQFDLAARSIYCDETGGDYFDFFTINDAESGENPQIGVAVGDVSGHGIGSALVMATARGALHALIDRHNFTPDVLIEKLNLHLCRSTADTYFMTLFYGVINPLDRSMVWLSAGHAPTFLYHTDGNIDEFDSSGIPLGILENTPYDTPRTIAFVPGDILLIGTDGIWEAQNSDKEMFGTDKVHKILARYADASADTIASQLIGELEEFRGTESQEDDVTLIVIKAT